MLVNYLNSDTGYTLVQGHSDAPRYTSAQQEAVQRMEEAAIYLCSRKGSEDDAPRTAWAAEVKKVAFAYGDQVVSKPEMLTWAQIEPGLPPEANCGKLEAVDSCSAHVRAPPRTKGSSSSRSMSGPR